ncbi:MAG TPA: ferritin-like protein [Solirubrobacterales bacterium]|nr:ferritin-like protein [Solirubrobacterales bacterium]
MNEPSEWTLEELHLHLQAAIEVELMTLPPYLTALFSLVPGKNAKAAELVHSVAMEEMLHFALAANVFNAVGGEPNLAGGGYVPRYPLALPFKRPGETVEVGLQPFSTQALEVFMAIEKPNHPDVQPPAAGPDAARPRVLELAEEYGYETIGAFYKAIEEGLTSLDARGNIFTGEPSRQIGPEFYEGAGGGHLLVISDLATALEALEEIVEQGEGDVDKPGPGEEFDSEGELAHYYRFKELYVGREYKPGDSPLEPTGPPIAVDYTGVFPIKPNLRAEELSGALQKAAEAFNGNYTKLIDQLQEGIDGNPERVGAAIETMIQLGREAGALVKKPLEDGSGLNAGPPWQFLGAQPA